MISHSSDRPKPMTYNMVQVQRLGFLGRRFFTYKRRCTYIFSPFPTWMSSLKAFRSPFQDLPFDVLNPVLSQLSDNRDWHACALVNKTFCRVATPLLYRTLDSRIISKASLWLRESSFHFLTNYTDSRTSSIVYPSSATSTCSLRSSCYRNR